MKLIEELARVDTVNTLKEKTDEALIKIVEETDPFGWQWRHRVVICALLHELSTRLKKK